MNKIKLSLTITLVGALAIGIMYYMYSDSISIFDVQYSPVTSYENQEEKIIEDNVENTIVKDDESFTENTTSTPIPNLDRDIIFYNELPEEAKIVIRENILTLTSKLKQNSGLFSEWIDLGVHFKIAGDYGSTRDMWEYASIIRPANHVSFTNLGDLYHYYLKDFTKAEKNLKTAIENNAQYTQAYIALHELYKYSYKQETTLAIDTLLEGIKENPDNTDLIITLAAYYKERGDVEKARMYYKQASGKAKELGNTRLLEFLDKELNIL
jgi:tetratricopeptide (TPR) repeat protein